MATVTADAIADLQALLRQCCDDLAGAPDEDVVGALEGPPGAGGTAPDLFDPSPGSTAASDVLAGDAGPRWRPLIIGLPPGVEQLVGIIKPPLDVIVTLLQVIAALLDVIKALLLALPDPFMALIEAAYQALNAIITDFINAGVYLYADVPGLTSPDVSLAELGFAPPLKTAFELGKAGEAAPPTEPDGFDKWAGRFEQSFDDPGDDARPQLSGGASVEAVFIVGAAPTLDALTRFAYLLGTLFNIEAFKRAVELHIPGSDDAAGSRIRGQSVAPDWKAARLKDLFPALEGLEELPRKLRDILLKVESVVGMLAELASAISDKVQALLDMAELVQDVIDLLDSLSGAGLYTLPVATNQGVEGLVTTFREAADRPAGDYVAGVCMLAAGPNLGAASILWEMIVAGDFTEAAETAWDMTGIEQAAEQTWGLLEEAGEDVGAAGEALADSASDAYDAMVDAIVNLPDDTVAALGRTREELEEMVNSAPDELYALLEEAKEVHIDQSVEDAKKRAKAMQDSGEAHLALYLDDRVRRELDAWKDQEEDG